MSSSSELLPPFTVGPWTADPSADELRGEAGTVKLEPRTMRLLVVLAGARGAVVTTDELLDAVWPGLVVTPGSLYEAVAQLRKALGHAAIATVSRKGYRLAASLGDAGAGASLAPALGPHSIAVLPFRLLRVPDAQAFLRESLAEGLIAELSRQPGLVVVARGTMLSYAALDPAPLDVCRELGVRHVVDGLIELRGDRLHVSVDVVDGQQGTQAWADAIELPLDAWPGTGHLVAARLARALNFELQDQAARMPVEGSSELTAHTLATRAWIELFARPESRASNERAADWGEQAQALAPRLPLASTCLAFCCWRNAQFGWTSEEPASSLRRGRAHAERAVALGPREPDAYYVSGLIAYSGREMARAEEALRHCLRLSASHAPGYGLLALIRTRRGHPEEAAALCDRAFALSPREPLRVVWHLSRAWAALALNDPAAALEASQRGMAVNPEFPTCYVTGAAAAQQLGRNEVAAAYVEFLRNRTVFKSLALLRSRLPPATEPAHVRQMEQVAEILGQAGMPPV